MSARIPLAAAGAVLLSLASVAQASSFTYRGYLEDGGAPAEGRYDIRLTAFADAHGPLPVAVPVEIEGVTLNAGQFAAALPEGAVPSHLDQAWLQVEVRAEGEGGWWALPGRQAIAPKGALCPPSWELTGNAGTSPAANFLGTTDNQPLSFRVNNLRVQRFEHNSFAPNIVGGHPNNAVMGESVAGAFVGGGGGQSQPNIVSNSWSSVLGGRNHSVSGENAAVVGGFSNHASGNGSVVAGGWNNTASALRSAVGGGSSNCAGGSQSWAGGTRAKVRPGSASGTAGVGCQGIAASGTEGGDSGTFMWADNQNADYVSGGPNRFLVRASGGVVFTAGAVNNPQDNLVRVNGTLRLDTLGSAGATTLCRNAVNQIASCSSSARYKSDIADLELGLASVERLRAVSYLWSASGEADVGFVAEEVAAIDPRLVTYNEDGDIEGVKYERLSALLAAAVQTLAADQRDQADALATLRTENAELRERIAALDAIRAEDHAALRAELAMLRELSAPISHRPPAADADPSAVARAAPSAGLDVVSTTRSPGFSPRRAPQRRLDALATEGGEKRGLAPAVAAGGR